MFFPRIVATDRLRGRPEVFANGGAIAGMLSRTGEAVSAVIAANDPEPLLRANARLARDVESGDRWRLAANGVNVLHAVRSPDRERPALRTLGCGASASSDWSYLSRRRFALFIINAIERGTRWAATRQGDLRVWERVAQQVRSFLAELHMAGAFAEAPGEQPYMVICDDRINDIAEANVVNLLVQFAASHAGDYHSVMITHSLHGTTVRPVAVNRFEASVIVSQELEQEITIRLEPGVDGWHLMDDERML